MSELSISDIETSEYLSVKDIGPGKHRVRQLTMSRLDPPELRPCSLRSIENHSP